MPHSETDPEASHQPLAEAPRLLFLGSAPTVGDAAIGLALLRAIRRRFPGAEIHIGTEHVDQYAGFSGVHAAGITAKPLGPSVADFRSEFAPFDGILFQGGPQWSDRWLDKGTADFHLRRLTAASDAGRPVAWLGSSFGPFRWTFPKRFYRRHIAARALRKTTALLTRDEESGRALEELLGDRGPKVLTASDVALTLDADETPRVSEILNKARSSSPSQAARDQRPYAVINLRSMRSQYPEAMSRERDLLQQVLELTTNIPKRFNLLLLPMNLEDDLPKLRWLQTQLPERNCILIEETLEPGEAAAVLRDADFLLSIRLHPLILSAPAGVPFLALGYEPKSQRFADQLGVSYWVLPYADFSVDQGVELLNQLLGDDNVEVREKLRLAAEHARNQTQSAIDRTLYTFAAALPG